MALPFVIGWTADTGADNPVCGHWLQGAGVKRIGYAAIATAVWTTGAASAYGLSAEAGWQRIDPATLAFTGSLDAARVVPDAPWISDADALRQALTPATRTIRLRSTGGDLAAALRMAETIRQGRLTLVVDGWCLAECAVVLAPAAAEVRLMPGAVLGFAPLQFTDPRPEVVADTLRRMGIDAAVTRRDMAGVEADVRDRAVRARGLIAASLQADGIDPGLLEEIDRLSDAAGSGNGVGTAPWHRVFVVPPDLLAARYGLAVTHEPTQGADGADGQVPAPFILHPVCSGPPPGAALVICPPAR